MLINLIENKIKLVSNCSSCSWEVEETSCVFGIVREFRVVVDYFVDGVTYA